MTFYMHLLSCMANIRPNSLISSAQCNAFFCFSDITLPIIINKPFYYLMNSNLRIHHDSFLEHNIHFCSLHAFYLIYPITFVTMKFQILHESKSDAVLCQNSCFSFPYRLSLMHCKYLSNQSPNLYIYFQMSVFLINLS